jgi:HSP20 family protein
MGLWHRSPAEAVNRLQDDVQRLMDLALPDFGSQFFNVWAPALDLYEDKEKFVIKVEAPGMKKDGFQIGLHDNVLSVSGERKFEERNEKSTSYRSERFEGRFQRSIALPKTVQGDKVTASYRDGILTVTLPIAEAARPKQITVSAE